MKFKKTVFGLFLALSIPTTSIADERYYDPYSKSACLGPFSPVFTPSPELTERLATFARPDRIQSIAQGRMNDAVNRHRAEQCIAMRNGLDPEPCPVGETIFFDPFLADVLDDFSGADAETIATAMHSNTGKLSRDEILEACEK